MLAGLPKQFLLSLEMAVINHKKSGNHFSLHSYCGDTVYSKYIKAEEVDEITSRLFSKKNTKRDYPML